jgi:hypothetical protein
MEQPSCSEILIDLDIEASFGSRSVDLNKYLRAALDILVQQLSQIDGIDIYEFDENTTCDEIYFYICNTIISYMRTKSKYFRIVNKEVFNEFTFFTNYKKFLNDLVVVGKNTEKSSKILNRLDNFRRVFFSNETYLKMYIDKRNQILASHYRDEASINNDYFTNLRLVFGNTDKFSEMHKYWKSVLLERSIMLRLIAKRLKDGDGKILSSYIPLSFTDKIRFDKGNYNEKISKFGVI